MSKAEAGEAKTAVDAGKAKGENAKPVRREDERAAKLAAALRANLARRKAARRAGLDDFGEDGSGDPGEGS